MKRNMETGKPSRHREAQESVVYNPASTTDAAKHLAGDKAISGAERDRKWLESPSLGDNYAR